MNTNFDLKKFLVENKLTYNSKALHEATAEEAEDYIRKTLIPNTYEKFESLMKSDNRFYDSVSNVIFDYEGEDDDDDDRAYNIWDGGNELRYDYIVGIL